MRFPWQYLPIRILAALLALAANAHLQAQGQRPGSAGRPTASATGGGFGGAGGGGGGGASVTALTATGPRQYPSHTLLGNAIIQIDPETRTLLIVTDEATHLELDKVIKSLDRPKPQVLIKVVFLEVTYDKDSDIGVEGSYTFKIGNNIVAPALTGTTTTSSSTGGNTTSTSNGVTTTTPSAISTTSNTSQSFSLPATGSTGTALTNFGLSSLTTGSFVRLMTDNWSATLAALNTHGRTEVLSRPTIMARNNQQAVIIVGSEVPFVTNSRVTDTGETINTVSYDNIGIILTVTPFINSGNLVEMIVAPEISALTDQTVAISNTAASPVISKRSAETVVVTPDGTTSVIGGLMQTQKTSTIQKIPYLGDIPVLGFPFKHTVKSEIKTELLIFLTPYIIRNDQGLEDETNDETGRTELVHKAFSERELDQYLQGVKVAPNVKTRVSTDPKQPPTPVQQTQVRRATIVARATPKPKKTAQQ